MTSRESDCALEKQNLGGFLKSHFIPSGNGVPELFNLDLAYAKLSLAKGHCRQPRPPVYAELITIQCLVFNPKFAVIDG